MIQRCEGCGGPIDEALPFATCPKCLFAEALAAGDTPEPVGDFPISAGESSPVFPKLALTRRPDFFKKYDLVKRLDGGGQGDVWEVWDFEFRRRVAMKRLARNDAASEPVVGRFLAEAQIASQLEHPGILPIFDVGLDPDGRPFYTTQLLPKRHLGDVLGELRDPASREWTLPRVLELLLRVCDIMAYAHGRRVIHRDLKPANILVGPFGDVRVIDWGSARVLGQARQSSRPASAPVQHLAVETDRQDAIAANSRSPQSTASSGQPITLLYAAPELLDGQTHRLGPATDIYAVGVMLYELLAGRLPYAGPDGKLPELPELERLIRAGPPEPVRNIRPAVSRDLAAVCAKAMERNTARRYQKMEFLAADLRAVLEVRPVAARNPGLVQHFQKWVRRNLPQVFLGTIVVAGAAIAWFAAQSLKAQRDAARQVHALSEAGLAARSGRWNDALKHWDAAEAAGYNDTVQLSLFRAEAWIVLAQKPRARVLLTNLLHRSDLGARRGAVLLRVGENEMFDQGLFEEGVRHVREALSNHLDAADTALAKGMLADSTPVALEFFHEAIRHNPYFHSAHRHALGLEFVLGRHDELASHLRVAKVLYPGDFSPGVIEMMQLTLQGRLPEALATLRALGNAVPPEHAGQMESRLRFLAKAADFFEVEAYLGERTNSVTQGELMAEATKRLVGGGSGDLAGAAANPLPQLPCVNQGIQDAFDGVKALALPLFGNQAAAVEKIKSSWRRHPEALFPTFAATFLNSKHPREGPRDPSVLATQAELYQMGADSHSILVGLDRLARLLAVDAQEELARGTRPDAAAARAQCLTNMQRALESESITASECRLFHYRAMSLKELDLARAFLSRWERLKPGDPSARRNRIRLETEAGAYGPALSLLDGMLKESPDNSWARSQRKMVLEKLGELANTHRVGQGNE